MLAQATEKDREQHFNQHWPKEPSIFLMSAMKISVEDDLRVKAELSDS